VIEDNWSIATLVEVIDFIFIKIEPPSATAK
jgi:hypothetical protein